MAVLAQEYFHMHAPRVSRRELLRTAAAMVAIAGVASSPLPALAGGAAGASSSAGVAVNSPADALRLMLEGNQRFVTGVPEFPNQDSVRRAELAQGQDPFAAVLSCSDSRVPPEMLFDLGLGDLFIVRIAGNVVEPGGLASLEYTVAKLGSKLIMVLGHSACGAVAATIDVVKNGTSLPGSLPGLVQLIKPAVQSAGDQIDAAIRANVAGAVNQLRTSSPVLSDFIARSQLQVVGGVYDLHTGVVNVTTP
jgi:carbonic anhydrase